MRFVEVLNFQQRIICIMSITILMSVRKARTLVNTMSTRARRSSLAAKYALIVSGRTEKSNTIFLISRLIISVRPCCFSLLIPTLYPGRLNKQEVSR